MAKMTGRKKKAKATTSGSRNPGALGRHQMDDVMGAPSAPKPKRTKQEIPEVEVTERFSDSSRKPMVEEYVRIARRASYYEKRRDALKARLRTLLEQRRVEESRADGAVYKSVRANGALLYTQNAAFVPKDGLFDDPDGEVASALGRIFGADVGRFFETADSPPTIDTTYLATVPGALTEVASAIREACDRVGVDPKQVILRSRKFVPTGDLYEAATLDEETAEKLDEAGQEKALKLALVKGTLKAK